MQQEEDNMINATSGQNFVSKCLDCREVAAALVQGPSKDARTIQQSARLSFNLDRTMRRKDDASYTK